MWPQRPELKSTSLKHARSPTNAATSQVLRVIVSVQLPVSFLTACKIWKCMARFSPVCEFWCLYYPKRYAHAGLSLNHYTSKAGSEIAQNKVIPTLWLATQSGKMSPSCSFGMPVSFPQTQFSINDFIIYTTNPLLTSLSNRVLESYPFTFFLCKAVLWPVGQCQNCLKLRDIAPLMFEFITEIVRRRQSAPNTFQVQTPYKSGVP